MIKEESLVYLSFEIPFRLCPGSQGYLKGAETGYYKGSFKSCFFLILCKAPEVFRDLEMIYEGHLLINTGG